MTSVCLDRIGVDLLGQRERLNARCLGALKTKGRGATPTNELDLGIECDGVDGVDERLQVGAGTREQHADGQRCAILASKGAADVLQLVISGMPETRAAAVTSATAASRDCSSLLLIGVLHLAGARNAGTHAERLLTHGDESLGHGGLVLGGNDQHRRRPC